MHFIYKKVMKSSFKLSIEYEQQRWRAIIPALVRDRTKRWCRLGMNEVILPRCLEAFSIGRRNHFFILFFLFFVVCCSPIVFIRVPRDNEDVFSYVLNVETSSHRLFLSLVAAFVSTCFPSPPPPSFRLVRLFCFFRPPFCVLRTWPVVLTLTRCFRLFGWFV